MLTQAHEAFWKHTLVYIQFFNDDNNHKNYDENNDNYHEFMSQLDLLICFFHFREVIRSETFRAFM